MTGNTQERTHFENEDWAVLDSGLEHKQTGYFIARDEVASRRSDGLWSWPLHVAEKSWCRMPAFMEAFSCATSVYGICADADLAQSFRMARSEIAVPPHATAKKADVDAGPQWPPALRRNDKALIFGEPARTARAATNSSRMTSPLQDRPRHREAAQGATLALTVRARLAHPDNLRAVPWRAPWRIGRAGTQIVRLLWAAWRHQASSR
jgi:hypothetical protein